MSRLAPGHVRALAGHYLGWLDILRALHDVDDADHYLRTTHQGGCADGYSWHTDGARVRCRVPGGDVGSVAVVAVVRAGLDLLDPTTLAGLTDAGARMSAHVDGDRAAWWQARADAARIWEGVCRPAAPTQLELFAA